MSLNFIAASIADADSGLSTGALSLALSASVPGDDAFDVGLSGGPFSSSSTFLQASLLPGATASTLISGDASGFDFTITVIDSTDEVAEETLDLIERVVEAALERWGEFINGAEGASLEIELTIEPPEEPEDPDEDGTTVASAGPGTFAIPDIDDFVDVNGSGDLDDGDILTLQAGSAFELITGEDVNDEEADINISVNSELVDDDSFFIDDTIVDGDVVPAGQIDLFSVLLHEIGHGLGFLALRDSIDDELASFTLGDGTSVFGQTAFDVFTAAGPGGTVLFNGPATVAAYGEAVVLESETGDGGSDLSHFAGTGTEDTGFSLLNPFVIPGDRTDIGALELAVLSDLGFDVSVPDDLPLINELDSVDAGDNPVFATAAASVNLTSGGVSFAVTLPGGSLFVGTESSVGVEVTALGNSVSQRVQLLGAVQSETITVSFDTLLGGDSTFVGVQEVAFDVRLFNPAQASLSNGTNEQVSSLNTGVTLFGDTDAGTVIQGTSSVDILLARGGDDTLIGGAGADILNGGAGVDTVDYSSASSGLVIRLFNGTGENAEAEGDNLVSIERVIGSNASDALIGSNLAVVETLDGGGGADFIAGLAGNDILIGGAGADVLDGGAGVDTVDYSSASSALIIRLFNGTGENAEAEGDSLVSIENIIGSGFGDSLIGSNLVTVETIDGGAGNDFIAGLAGNDVLIGGAGADVLNGGAGVDTVNYSDASSALIIRLFNGTGENAEAQGDTLVSIERVVGSDFNDALIGSSDAVVETLEGGAGSDFLAGLGGADILIGGAGSDVLVGGAGADTFVFEAGFAQTDRIDDFAIALGDVIRIDNSSVSSFAALAAIGTQDGADTVFDFSNGAGTDVLRVEDVQLSDLSAGDFEFGTSASTGSVLVSPPDGSDAVFAFAETDAGTEPDADLVDAAFGSSFGDAGLPVSAVRLREDSFIDLNFDEADQPVLLVNDLSEFV